MAKYKRKETGEKIRVDHERPGRPLSLAGRKEKIDEIIVQKLEYAFSIGCPTLEACSFAGISRQTYYTFVKRYPQFLDRFNDLKANPILKARESVVKAIDENPDIAFKYLERRRPKEFGNNLKLTDGDGKPLPINGTVNNNLIAILDNADENTRKNWVELSRRLLASKRSQRGGDENSSVSSKPSSSN